MSEHRDFRTDSIVETLEQHDDAQYSIVKGTAATGNTMWLWECPAGCKSEQALPDDGSLERDFREHLARVILEVA